VCFSICSGETQSVVTNETGEKSGKGSNWIVIWRDIKYESHFLEGGNKREEGGNVR
jgi:hypothetical protein